MLSEVTNEIIDAILFNERRQAHPRRSPSEALRTQPMAGNRASLKPDWCQLPPGTKPGASA
jgi:hypothetical protein